MVAVVVVFLLDVVILAVVVVMVVVVFMFIIRLNSSNINWLVYRFTAKVAVSLESAYLQECPSLSLT